MTIARPQATLAIELEAMLPAPGVRNLIEDSQVRQRARQRAVVGDADRVHRSAGTVVAARGDRDGAGRVMQRRVRIVAADDTTDRRAVTAAHDDQVRFELA
jgi:hypothetical protein